MRNGFVSVYDTETLALVGSVPASSPSTLTFSSDGQHCYVASAANSTGVLDVDTSTLLINRTLAPSLDVTFWVGLAPNGQTLYTLSNQSIYAVSLSDGTIVSSVYVGRNPNLAALTSDGTEIYIGEKSGYLVIYDTGSAAIVRTELSSSGVDGLSATRF